MTWQLTVGADMTPEAFADALVAVWQRVEATLNRLEEAAYVAAEFAAGMDEDEEG